MPIYTPGKLVLKKDSVATDPNTDPNFASVSLLLYGNGTNGSTTITDNSPSPKTVTAYGNAQISTAQSKFGGSSITFDGTTSYLQSASNAAFAFGTGDFTIEFWAYLNSTADQAFYETQLINGVGNRTNGFLFAISSGKLNVFSNGSFRGASTTSLSSGTWNHIALVRGSGTWTYYLNGVNDGSYFYPLNSTESEFLCGRLTNNPGYFLNGYLDEYRVTKTARYLANFTPPTTSFPDY